MDTPDALLKKLKSNPKNPRKISKDEKESLKQKILGFPKMLEKRPIVYDESYIVLGGNQRLTVVCELVKEGFELKQEYFSSASGWTKEEKRKFVILDNISDGDWDYELIKKDWSDLPLQDWGIDQNKWDTGDVKEDEAPAISDGEAESKLGEVYQLGRHRLMCGDSTDAGSVVILMNGQKADMVFTDPPYGVSYEEKTKNIANQRKDTLQVMGDDMGIEEMGKIVQKAFVNLSNSIKDGAGYYVCSPQGGDMELMMMMMMRDAGIKCRHQIIWKKDAPVFSMGRLDYDYMHEPILYGWKKSHQFYSKNERSVWEIARPKSSKLHPTMKPIELCAKAIKNSSKDGDIVIDLFGGSGSTLIACEQTNRTCYMMELDPHYCDVIRKRYYKFTHEDNENGWEKGTKIIE